MKRSFSIILAVVMLAAAFSCVTVSAETHSGECGDDLTWSLDTSAGVLTVSGTGAMDDFRGYVFAPWYDYRSEIKTVVIKPGVTTVGERAFSYCSDMTGVTIPSTVTSIENNAFEDCRSLKSVTFPTGLTKIDYGAFKGCSSLKSVTVPNGCATIGGYAFYGCSSLAKISIPDSITHMGSHAFTATKYYNEQPDGPVYAGKFVCGFKYVEPTELDLLYGRNKKPESAAIKKGTVGIADGTFTDETTLKTVTLPSSLRYIGANAFKDCRALTDINIPDGLKEIGSSAFKGCWYLKNIDLPDSINEIGSSAFSGCSCLEQINIPKGVTVIENGTFESCSKIKSLIIPGGVTKIGKNAFCNCPNLKSVTFPLSLKTVEEGAFYAVSVDHVYYAGCKSEWKQIEVGQKNNTLSHTLVCFDACIGKAEHVYGKNDVCTVCGRDRYKVYSGSCGSDLTWTLDTKTGELAVSGTGDMQSGTSFEDYCDYIKTVTVGSGVTGIANEAFSGCTNVTAVNIPDSVVSIGRNAFDGCTALTDVNVGSGVRILGNKAFNNTAWYDGKPDGLVYTGKVAYKYKGDCPASVTIRNGTAAIAENAFQSVKSLESVFIPDSVTHIGGFAFFDTGLASVNIPDGVTYIGTDAFYGCECLEEVTVGKGVARIEDGAFATLRTLRSVYYRGTSADWEKIVTGKDNFTTEGAELHFNSCIGAAEHVLENKWSDNASEHWRVCAVCGERSECEAHKFEDGVCTVCGRDRIPKGDLDENGDTTADDAIYLLYHVFFPSDYPVLQDCDLDGDGGVTANDAIYLLYHVFFTSDYPLVKDLSV